MSRVVAIVGGRLQPEDVVAVAREGAKVFLSPAGEKRLAAGAARLAQVEAGTGPVPLWKLADLTDDAERPAPADLTALARHVILDHAVAVGRPLPTELVRAAMLVRADVFAQGYSGVRPELAERLVDMLNREVHPIVPAHGHFSVAGDVAPLAHLALVLCAGSDDYSGSGQAALGWHEAGAPILPGGEAMRAARLEPVRPNLKEAFSLIVGHSFAAGWAALLIEEAWRLWRLAVAASALTCEALLANTAAFDPRLLGLGPGREWIVRVGERLHGWTAGSRMAGNRQRADAFSIRCIPQVLGAVAGVLDRVGQAIGEELGLASDNPVLIDDPEGPRCLDGGNFHGARLSLAVDNLRLAMAEIGSLAERHAFLLTNGSRNSGLPSFLIRRHGLNSGFMLAQYTAAALVSENKALALPYATDSIPSVQDYEDHAGLSLHSTAVTDKLLTNVRRVLAIEFLLAAQGVELRLEEGKQAGRRTLRLHDEIRRTIPVWEDDTVLSRRIEQADALCRPGGGLDRLARETRENDHDDE
ncbi:MAG: aromatic amino acid lyase [Myxococcales bacterium]|nr:aromatic amino acid lyase [Myxococcales bacterium]